MFVEYIVTFNCTTVVCVHM